MKVDLKVTKNPKKIDPNGLNLEVTKNKEVDSSKRVNSHLKKIDSRLDDFILEELDVSPPSDEVYIAPKELLHTFRQNKDYEVRFYFNPARYKIEVDDLKQLFTRISFSTGSSGLDLAYLNKGEIIVHLNPLIGHKGDAEYIIKLFKEYFENTPQITM